MDDHEAQSPVQTKNIFYRDRETTPDERLRKKKRDYDALLMFFLYLSAPQFVSLYHLCPQVLNQLLQVLEILLDSPKHQQIQNTSSL